MVKKTVEYVDFNGEKATETCYFNLTKAELIRMDAMYEGGLKEAINRATGSNDVHKILSIFEDILARSYGKKSSDGRRFFKSEEDTKEFLNTEAYSEIFVNLLNNPEEARNFVADLMTTKN